MNLDRCQFRWENAVGRDRDGDRQSITVMVDNGTERVLAYIDHPQADEIGFKVSLLDCNCDGRSFFTLEAAQNYCYGGVPLKLELERLTEAKQLRYVRPNWLQRIFK